MERLEFELETRDAAEQFRKELEAKIPANLKRENWHYSNEKHGMDFFHETFQNAGRIEGTYSYELTPDGKYICILDLRDLPGTTIEVPGKIITPNTFEFYTEAPEFLHLMRNGIAEEFQKRGFELLPTTGRHYPAFALSHQAISKDRELVVRYDLERNGNDYLCHLDSKLTREEYEQIKDLMQEWTEPVFMQNFF